MKKSAIRISDEAHMELRRICSMTGNSMGWTANEVILAWAKKQSGEELERIFSERMKMLGRESAVKMPDINAPDRMQLDTEERSRNHKAGIGYLTNAEVDEESLRAGDE
jgi:hypothetical protein